VGQIKGKIWAFYVEKLRKTTKNTQEKCDLTRKCRSFCAIRTSMGHYPLFTVELYISVLRSWCYELTLHLIDQMSCQIRWPSS